MNKGKNNRIIKIFMLICILILIYSLINIIIWYIDNKKNSIINNEIKELINVPLHKDTVVEEEKKYNIDFPKLKKINNDVVGYIKVNNTNIDYVVVKGKDNAYYLKHNLYKESNRAGWIFMDYHNNLDGNDKNIIIYGHNTMDGSMFGTLRNVVKKEWYTNSDNYIVNLNLEQEEKKYQVFSTYSIKVEDYYIKTDFKSNKEFGNFINVLKARSVYNYNVNVSENDHILTLSTCTGNGKQRMVLHAKEILD